jgi:superfamily II DNA or RNA helicase
MTILTRNGILIQNSTDIKRELTVRPIAHEGLAPSFKVFRQVRGGTETLLVPRYWALERFGASTKDSRRTPVACGNINFVGKLRDETKQPEAFASGVKAFEEKGGGVLSVPPGFGKTTIALALSAHLKLRTLIVVHKEFLANQWRDRIQQFCPGTTIGRIQQDVCDTDKDFVIAMIQTLCSRDEEALPSRTFDQFGFLIVDEAHHIGAAAFSQAMFRFCPKYTLGLTATPERKDGLTRILYWFLGPEFFRLQRENQKTTRVEVIPYSDPLFKESPPVTRFGKINMAQMVTDVTELPIRNEFITKIAKNSVDQGRRVLILTDRREHCQYFQKEFGPVLSGLYYGGLKESELEESSRKRIIIGTFAMAQEGLDIPVLDTIILASPKSDITQAIGRIMRETPGKLNNPLIYDIADHWSVFHSMARKRMAVYKASGFEITGTHEDEKPVEVFGKGLCLL